MMFKRWRGRRTRRVYRFGGGWGDRIEFKYDDAHPIQPGTTARVFGWKAITPAPGDYLTGRLSDGREAIARFTAVERYANPPDMFLATVQGVDVVPSDRLTERLQELEPTATIITIDRLATA
jgi:hypothetical protein